MCLFEVGACLSAPDAARTITHATTVSTYTIKIKEIMVDIVHCQHCAAVVVVDSVAVFRFMRLIDFQLRYRYSLSTGNCHCDEFCVDLSLITPTMTS